MIVMAEAAGVCQGPLARPGTALYVGGGGFITTETLQLLYLKPDIIYVQPRPLPFYLSLLI